jgi:YD repeat-containing protein
LANRIVTAIQGAVITTSSYNNAGNPILENRLGALTSFVYDGENKMVKQTNPDGKVTTNTYSGSGLKRSYQEFGGTVHTLVWDDSDYLGEVTA